MKILFIISRFYPFIGGFEYHTYQLASNLVQKGHEVTVLTTDSLVKAPKTEVINGIRIIRKKSFGMIPLTRIPISPGIYSLPKENFDIVNVFGCIPFISDLTLFFAKQKKLKTVYTHVFDPIGNEFIYKTGIYKIYNLFAKLIVKKYADSITTLTNDYIRSSSLLNGLKNVHAIPSGVEKSFYRFSNKERIKLKKKFGNKKIILFVGRLDAYKGVKYLVDSLKYLKNDVLLLIAGEGNEKIRLEKQVLKNKLENVRFLGIINRKKLLELYNTADIFVLPAITKQEVFGKVNIEAMACGIPVIATNLPGVREVVKDCGLIVEPKNPTKLAEAVNKILGNRKLAEKFSKNGLKKVKDAYDWDKIAQKTMNLYKSL